jgi:hypothetical protein
VLSGMHGRPMIERADAVQIQRLALEAVSFLTSALDIAVTRASPETLAELKKGVGLSIGAIETNLLSVLYRLYPEMGDLSK